MRALLSIATATLALAVALALPNSAVAQQTAPDRCLALATQRAPPRIQQGPVSVWPH